MKYLKLLLIIVLFFSFAIVNAREVIVEATGTAYFEGKNLSKAFDDALIDAQVKAIQQGCGLNLISVVKGNDYTNVTEILTSNTSGRIISYNEIKREKIDNNNVLITIKAIVTNTDPKAIVINTTGYCLIENNNIPDAKKGALTEAKKQAIEQGCGVSFESKTIGKNFTEVDEILQSYTKGYISEYEVLDEKVESGNYCVKIKAYVKKVDEEIKNIQTEINEENKYCKIENNKLLAYTGEEKVVKIPYGVYSIEADVFADNQNIEEVILPDTLVSIGNGAFRNCKNLRIINLHNNISSIGAECFSGCISLVDVQLPDNLTVVEENCFFNCIGLKSINTNNVVEIKYRGFAHCYNLSKIELSNKLKKMDHGAFECFDPNQNKFLKKLVIPSSVESIGEYAFQDYPNIEELIIERGVKKIEKFAFLNEETLPNKSLKKLVIPGSVEVIGEWAFQCYPNIEELIIENGVKKIEYGAFINTELTANKSLKKLVIPGSVEVIGVAAFQGYPNIEELIIENGVKKIEQAAFQTSLATANRSLKKLVIPGSVEVVGRAAFQGLTNLEELIIVNGVKKIEHGAFKSLQDLPNQSLKKIIIPGSVEEIGESAFNGYLNVEEIILEPGIKKIGKYAFLTKEIGNKSLRKLIIPGSVEIIGECAFGCYSNLEELIIENGVKKIEGGAFMNIEATENKSLKRLVIPSSVEEIGEGAFQHNSNIKELIIEPGIKKIASFAFLCTNPNKSLQKLTIPGSVEVIGERAFQCYSNIEELIIENGVKKIELGAFVCFEACPNKSLRKLVFPGTVEYIGEGAFQLWEELSEVSLSRKTKIEDNTFIECSNVEIKYRD